MERGDWHVQQSAAGLCRTSSGGPGSAVPTPGVDVDYQKSTLTMESGIVVN